MSAAALLVGWEEIERLVVLLASRLAHGPPRSGADAGYDRVLAVARGGLVPAALLACRLGIRPVEAVRVVHYEGTRRLPKPVISGGVPSAAGPSGDPSRTLVVDDVLETGGTILELAERFPDATYAVLVAKRDDPPAERDAPASLAVPGSSVRAVSASIEGMERWVVFPWSDRVERP